MRRIAGGLIAGLIAIIFFAPGMRAGTVHGTVNNGTTGKPGAGVEVVLIQLQGSMQPVANTKTDASGNFTFDNPGIGAQPMLVRAIYKGVNFHQPLPPGKDSITVDVFEPTGDAKTISVPSHVVIFQPSGSSLLVGEEYGVKNESKPPQAFFKLDGNFEAALPENAELKQIAAAGPSGMPVVQAPIDKGKNKYAISFAFRPGESEQQDFGEATHSLWRRAFAGRGAAERSGNRRRFASRGARAGNDDLHAGQCPGRNFGAGFTFGYCAASFC